MKILYDYQTFTLQVYGGISRYFFELMNQFQKDRDVDFELAIKYSDNHYLNNVNFANHTTFCKTFRFRGRNRIMHFFNERQGRNSLAKQEFDIFHPTYYHTYFLDYIGNKPFVLTIYDMIHEIFRQDFPTTDKSADDKKILAQRAAKIIAISENTKKDIVQFYNIGENKIEVIYLGNSLSKLSACAKNLLLPEKYILFVGDRNIYKNFEFFIKGLSNLMIEDPALNVVCAGGGPFSASENALFTEMGVEKKVYQYTVADEMLSRLYQDAVAFVFPSLYEGFGIPVLEAFACGCAVISSNTSSLPEVGGEAVLYFDPRSEISIKKAVSKVIYNKELRDNLRAMGLKQLEKFSWEKTADETKAVYRSIL